MGMRPIMMSPQATGGLTFELWLQSRCYVNDSSQITYAEVYAASSEWTNRNTTQLFRLPAASAVLAHRLRKTANSYRKFRHEVEDDGPAALLDAEFQEKYGPDPLSLMNDPLEPTGFKLVEVSSTNQLSVQLALENCGGVRINQDALSTGECVLFSLLAAMFHGLNDGEFPEALLLDEAGAFLHPAAIGEFLSQLKRVFIEKAAVSALLVTHAPSLVALSPEDSTFIMQRNMPRLRQCSRDEAIGHLTAGVPTLRIEPSNCRQVFVESDWDAKVYPRIYEFCRAELSPEIGLSFISSGTAGDDTGSCEKVKMLARGLFEKGVRTVRGIIDWDKKNKSDDVVWVLGEGERYTLENAALDPLLVGLFIKKFRPDRMIAGPTHFTGSDKVEKAALQEMAADVATRVLRQLAISPSVHRKVQYLGRLELEHPIEYLHNDGKSIASAIVREFPEVGLFIRSEIQKLKVCIVEQVMREYPQFIPKIFVNLLAGLQSEVPR